MSEPSFFQSEFYGTETYWSRGKLYGDMVYTDSVKDFCEKHNAQWMIDLVGSHYGRIKVYNKEHDGNTFVLLTIIRNGKGGATFKAETDTDGEVIVSQEIEYTDLTTDLKLYLIGAVLMFPEDY